MTLFTSARIIAIAAAAQLLFGCALVGSNQTTDPAREQLANPNSGYALLYAIVSVQKNSDKILIIRKVSPDVSAMTHEISDLAGDLDTQLKQLAKDDPSIKLDAVVLPMIEVKQRESAALERAKQFLAITGKPFERLLLLTESGVLTTERHLTRVMGDEEKNPQRKIFWKNAQQRFDQIYAKLRALLESQYFAQ
jgi:hypothetical protein